MSNQCPFHDLDPHSVVNIYSSEGYLQYRGSAQLLCETWHDTEPIRAFLISAMFEATMTALG